MRRLPFFMLLFLLPFAVQPAAGQMSASETTRLPAPTTAPNAPEWLTFKEALAASSESGKKIMLFIYAPWCGYCQKMMNEVYSLDDVQETMAQHYEFAYLNGTITTDSLRYMGHTLSSQQIAVGLGMRGYPTHVFLSSEGEYIAHQPGYLDTEPFIKLLGYMGADAYKNQSFQEFIEANE